MIVCPRLTCTVTGSMRLINIDAFFRRESLIHSGEQVERRTKVLEFRDDETTEYAILSHRWIDPTEVDYEEMVGLAKMNRQEQDEIRGRLGYKKIVDTCKQAKQDGYEWVWIDTCCIDKRSSAELSEAINSMYRWYANAKICYAYLHDVDDSFPTEEDKEKYRKSNGWPEWFSRGWTLQEMIAPRNLHFFNKDWQPIGNKKTLVRTLEWITRVPGHTLTGGLEGNRPCVAQIISWASNRTTTRVEDRAYSLMGLLDASMPMLYGEGKKAFHRLQLEFIRSSNDQSIFAWGHKSNNNRIGSILADDPSDFEDCSCMKLMDHNEFFEEFPELSLTSADHFDVFPITNRGIQIWMPFHRYRDSNSVFRAYLPCQYDPHARSLVSIDLVLWNYNYYRYPSAPDRTLEKFPTEFHQVYLRYQDTPNQTVTFDIDDSAVIENGFTRSLATNLTGNTVTLTNAKPLCITTYCQNRGNACFQVVYGQYFGLDWVHLDAGSTGALDYVGLESSKCRGPDWALSMANKPSKDDDSSGRLWISHCHLPKSTWVLRTYRVARERSKVRLRMEVFQDSSFQNRIDEWKAYDVEVCDFFLYMDHCHDHV